MASPHRVAVTGLGAVTPLGVGARETWEALCAGGSGIRNERPWLEAGLPGFAKLRTHLAARVRDYDLASDPRFPAFATRTKARERDREVSPSATLALRAAAEALDHAGLLTDEFQADGVEAPRFAVMLGSGIGGASALGRVAAELNADKRPHSTQMYQMQPDNPTVVVKRFFGARGPSLGITQACASGGVAVALAATIIERGEADVVVAGGAEALDPSIVALFEATGAANDAEDPTNAVQPFDANAGGAILADGAGVVVLERYEHARARGAPVLAVVDGFAITGGAGSPSLMEEEGVVRAMLLALERSSLEPGEPFAISPHATGTRAGDRVEASAIRQVAADAGGRVASVFPIKGGIGHPIGAAGGIEAVVSTLALEAGVVPPAPTVLEPLAEVRELLPGASQPEPLAADAVLSNSMGFGDQTVSLLVRRDR